MLARNSILAALLAASGAALSTGSVFADHAEERQPLHAARGPVAVVVQEDAVLNRTRVLRRLDRALAEIDELAALAQEVPYTRHRGPARGLEHVQATFGIGGVRRAPVVSSAEVRARAERVRNQLVNLRRMAERAPSVPEIVEPAIAPITARDMNLFLGSLRQARFSNQKLALVRDLTRHAYVTSEQAARILRELPSWIQVDAGLLLYDVTVDPVGYHQVCGACRYQGDRDRLREAIARRRR